MFSNTFDALKGYVAKHPYAVSVGILSSLCSLFLHRPILLLLFTAVLLVLYMPIKGQLLSSVVPRIILAITIVTGLFQVEALALWVLDIWVSSTIYAFTTLVLVGLWLARTNPNLRPTVTFRPWIDAVIVIPCLLIGGVYVAKTFVRSPNDQSAAIVRSITFGMDDATHAHMLADMLHHDNNILSGEKREHLLSRGTTRTYPMGWHITAGITVNSAFGQQERTAIQNVSIYFYAKLLSLIYVIGATGLFVHILLTRFNKKIQTLQGTLLSLISTLFVSFIVVMPLFYEGFFSFLPILAYTVLFAALLIDTKPSASRLLILGLLAAASATSWVLTGPVLLLALALQQLSAVSSWRQLPRLTYAVLALGSAVFAVQAYIILAAGAGMVTQLADPGGIMAPDHLLLLAGIASLALLLFNKDKDWRETGQRLLLLALSFAVALAAVFTYIGLRSNEITYYYSKIQSVLLLLLVPILAVLISSVVLRMAQKEKNPLMQYATLAIVPVVLCLIVPGLIGFGYFRDTLRRSTSFGISQDNARIIAHDILDERSSKNNERSFFVVPDQPPLNILGSNAARIAYPSVECDYSIFSAVYTYDLALLNKELKKCVPVLPTVKIYTTDTGEKQLRKQIEPQLLQKEVEIVAR